jgi:hypothetical protein
MCGREDPDFILSVLNPIPGAKISPAMQSAVFGLLQQKMQQLEAKVFRHLPAGVQHRPAGFDAFLKCTLRPAAPTATAAAAGPKARASLAAASAAAEPLLPVAAAAIAAAADDGDAASVLRLRGGRGGSSSTASLSDDLGSDVSDDGSEQVFVQGAQHGLKQGSSAFLQESVTAGPVSALAEEGDSTTTGSGSSDMSLSGSDAHRLSPAVVDVISEHVSFWTDRAASKQQQQLLLQELSTAGQLPEPKLQYDLQYVPQHFVGMGRQEAAVWVELAVLCVQHGGSRRLRTLMDK